MVINMVNIIDYIPNIADAVGGALCLTSVALGGGVHNPGNLYNGGFGALFIKDALLQKPVYLRCQTPMVMDEASLVNSAYSMPPESLLRWPPYVGHPPLVQIGLMAFHLSQPWYLG